MRRAEAGLLTPRGSEAMHIQLTVASEVARASGGGSSGSGGGGGVRGCRLQHDNNADAVGGNHYGCKGTLLANPVCIPLLTLQVGDNTQDILQNVALPTLGGSVWCKR